MHLRGSSPKFGSGSVGERPLDYPFPLQTGQIANLRLPVRITKADAERMAAFIRTLAFEPELQIEPPGKEGD